MSDYYARQNIPFDLNGPDLETFDKVIFKLRRVERHRIRESGLLLEEQDLLDLDMMSDTRRVRLKFRVGDYYLIGYVRGESSTLWEMCSKVSDRVLVGSKPLGFDVNYTAVRNRSIGYKAINHAFETLFNETSPDKNQKQVESALITLAIMFSECARFQWVFLEAYRRIESCQLVRVPSWMCLIVNRWSLYTKLAKKDLPENVKFPEEVPRKLIRMFNQFDLEVFADEKFGPYFARLVIRAYHIPSLNKVKDCKI